MPRTLSRLLTLTLVALSATGCYWNEGVAGSQVGLRLGDGVKIDDVVGPGRYSDFGWYASIAHLDVSSKTVNWKDPDLVTSDKQPLEVGVDVTFARKGDRESATLLWNRYRAEATSDEALSKQVLSRIPSQAKTVTAQYSLDQLIGTAPGEGDGRPIVTKKLFDLLKPELDEFGVQLLNVRFTNFQPHAEYLVLLRQKAQVELEKEISVQRTVQLQQQLEQERAQTNIELEKANRTNQVAQKQSEVYKISPEAYELEKLNRLKDVLGDKATVYFVPQGSDISLFFNGEGARPPAVINQPRPAAPAPSPQPQPVPPTPAKPQAPPQPTPQTPAKPQ